MATNKLQHLIDKRNAVNARIKREQSKLKAVDRRSDTRRKVLTGALVLEWAAKDADFSRELMVRLDRFLVRDIDRALFGLSLSVGSRPSAPSLEKSNDVAA